MTIISDLNPIKYVPLSSTVVPQYTSKHIDDWRFSETLFSWQEKVCFNQPWLFQDTIAQQIISNVAPLRLRLIDLAGKVWYDDTFQQKQQIITMPGFFIYESRLALSAVDKEGIYYLRLDIGTDETNAQISAVNLYLSNSFESSETKENTLLLEYRHPRYYQDVFFETGFAPNLRVPGQIVRKKSAARTSTWEDQAMRMKMIKRMPYTVYNWQIGSSAGIPPWFTDEKINSILGCKELKLDGRLYTINGGAEIEDITEEDYPLIGSQIEMRDALNRGSRIIDSGDSQRGPITVVATTDGKGFGLDSGNSNYQIIDIV